MSKYVVPLRFGRYLLYEICYNADRCGTQPHVLFKPEDHWYGNDYWMHQGTFQAPRLTRAAAIMQKLEFKNQTNRYVYRLAQAIVLTELGHITAAQRQLQKEPTDDRSSNSSNGTV